MAAVPADLVNSRFDELCRLCAAKTTNMLGINIFENEGALRQVNKKIQSCLPIHVFETDNLPKMVCESCLYKLELFWDFRDRSVKTQRLLFDLLKELTAVANRQNQQPISVVMDQNDLIMVQHHPLLNPAISSGELDLSHLGHHPNNRDGDLIVEHEIILSHHHALDAIDLNNHDLSQDLSNHHSIHSQDSLMTVQTTAGTHSIVDGNSRFTVNEDNLNLMHQENFLSEFRLHQELDQVQITGNSAIDLHLANNMKVPTTTYSHPSSHYQHNEDKQLQLDKPPTTTHEHTYTNSKYYLLEDQHLNAEPHFSDEKYSNLPMNPAEEPIVKNESYEENSNASTNSLLIADVKSSSHSRDSIPDTNAVDNNKTAPLTESFTCNLCKMDFDNKSSFEKHYKSHFFKCSICHALFTNYEALKSHYKGNHGLTDEEILEKKNQKRIDDSENENESEDDEENESGDKFEEDEREQAAENDEDGEGEGDDGEEEEVDDPSCNEETDDGNRRRKWSPKVCKECGKSYKTNYKLAEHMRKHTGEKPYKCNSCEKAFRSKIGLAQHEAKHTGKYIYSCVTCGKGFQCKSYLMVHQRVHSDVKPYPCTTCGQNFKTKQSLLDHTNRHLGVKPYMCEICGRGFITKGLCKAHQKIHSGLDNRKYSCKICNKMFVSKSYLQTHLRIHTGEKPFMCEVCGKGFLTRVDLRIHSTMHTGEKSFVCEICGKAFARRDALRCHRRSHTGERPYVCDLCGQSFTQFTPMAIHKRLHTGERPYSCETCGKRFVSRSTMSAHAKKHDR